MLFGMAPYVLSLTLFNDDEKKPHMAHNRWKSRYVPILSTTLQSSFSYLSKIKLWYFCLRVCTLRDHHLRCATYCWLERGLGPLKSGVPWLCDLLLVILKVKILASKLGIGTGWLCYAFCRSLLCKWSGPPGTIPPHLFDSFT
jgi:hypothetical protein